SGKTVIAGAPSSMSVRTASSSGGCMISREASAIGCSGRAARILSRIASKGRAHSRSRAPWGRRTVPGNLGPLMLPGRAEAARAARAFAERVDHVELDLNHGDDHELRDALEGIHGEGLASAIPAGDQHLSLVVGIDEADEVAEHDAVLVAEARTRN